MAARRIAGGLLIIGVTVLGFIGASRTQPVLASDSDDDARITLRDDCDPRDPTWAPTGGCALRKGDVDRNEFQAFVRSPLSDATIGHPAWRFDPAYLKVEEGETLEVRNRGGRVHTFTEVDEFGGGRVPPLNFGLRFAPRCTAAADLPPGAETKIAGLSVGNHRFQCCIHPWMRTVVKVKPQD